MDVRENRFLESFSPGGRERLIGRLVYQELVPGEYLFREGEPAEGVCLVQEGEVEIVKNSGGYERVLATFGGGDFFGEVAVLDSGPRSSDARARTPVSVAWIPAGDLLTVLMNEPVTLTLQLFQNVLAMLRRTNSLYVDETVRKEKMSLVGEMAGSLMHDIRNPVQVILSSLEVIRLNHKDEETLDCCQKMEKQCDRLTAMAGELLEFSRGETKLNLTRTDTESLLLQFERDYEDAMKAAGAIVVLESDPAEIEVDVARILRVLQNLVFNAAQAINYKPGGRIDVQAWVADSVFYLSVRDNGPGIPNQVRERIFEPFVTFGKQGGTGLGLPIVNNVVMAHRGKITFETQAGQGTEFLIRLPQDATSRPVS